MSNKYTSLAKNTAIFAIGSFGSKILSFLIVPLYTYVLTTEEYGTIDLFTTTISLMLPFCTMLIQEALIRFLMSKEIDQNIAISNCMLIYFIGSVLACLLYPLYKRVFNFDDYIGLFLVLLLLNCFTQIFSQQFRAIGANIDFSINGVIVTAVTVFANLYFLIVLKLGMVGYFYSMILAQVCSFMHIIIRGRIFKYFSIKKVRLDILKDMLKFSIPLIPNSLMWWIMSAGDKYIINYYLGDGANGLYSLAMKIPTILSMVYSIFYQAWQLSAIEENDKNGRAKFYTNVYVATTALLIVLTSGIIVLVKPFYELCMNDSFIPAWSYVPMLSVAMVLNCVASFFGVVYTVSKKSNKAFFTTFMGMIVNLFFNFLLIRPLGLHGVAIGTAIGYAVVVMIRSGDAKKEIGMKCDGKRTSFAILLLVIQNVLTIIMEGYWIYLIGLISLIIIGKLYQEEIKVVLKKIVNRIN